MNITKIQQIFHFGWNDYLDKHSPWPEQRKAARAIMACKTGSLGYNISICNECGSIKIHNNSCRNRNCPNCQVIKNEVWIDKRRSEVIDSAYFHVVFTVPAALNPLFYANQAMLYDLLHKSASQSLLELTSDDKYLGALPGIIQVLHTWGQELNYHPHIHCIVSGTGITKGQTLLKGKNENFFLPAKVLGRKFKGKFLNLLNELYVSEKLQIPSSYEALSSETAWIAFKNSLYEKEWCPEVKETFRGNGNAIDYLGRYANRIAITNTRIISVNESAITFSAKDYRNDGQWKEVTISNVEFIRRFLMHVLPFGFQKIRYFGFLNNRQKKRYLTLIFRIQGKQLYTSQFFALDTAEIMRRLWNYDIHFCEKCSTTSMRRIGRTFYQRE